jgi:hypothetical protein
MNSVGVQIGVPSLYQNTRNESELPYDLADGKPA